MDETASQPGAAPDGAPRDGARRDTAAPPPTDLQASSGHGGDDARGGPRSTGGTDSAAQDSSPGHPERGKKRGRSFARELLILAVVAVFLTIVIKTYVVQAFYIPSGSMENTLEIGDRVLVNKLVYDFRPIHRGDIIVFSGDGSWNPNVPLPSRNFFIRFVDSAESMVGLGPVQNDYIKRVIGLPGDVVACCNAHGDVTVNGVALHERSYLFPGNAPSQPFGPVKVPPGSLWVMGDHRSVSYDSRGHMGDPGGGAIPESAVVGRAFMIIWPPSQWRILPIPKTFDQPQLNASHGRGATAAMPLRPAGSGMPLALGFAGAVPVTWLQRRLRRAIGGRLARRRSH